MQNWIRRLLGRKSGNDGARLRAYRSIRARYDAAVTNDENRRHWAGADGLSANAANSASVRRILRNRARYEVANNSYARGLVLTLANDVIGTGPRLQMLTADAGANRFVEREFSRWAQAAGLAEKLRTMRMARAEDGEAFAILTSNPHLNAPVSLDLRLVEADQVASSEFPTRTSNEVDGIVFDGFGNPIEYRVLKHHPGDMPITRLQHEFDRIPAASMVHLFRCDRPGQARGIPDITPALPLFAHLRRYTLAVIMAAEIAALPGGVLYTDAPAGGESESVEPMDTIELERGMLMTMPGGWRMGQLRAEQPTTTFSEFVRQILAEIARCMLVPVNVMTGDSSQHNYASGRLDHQTYQKSIRVEQSHIGTFVLDRILAAWLDEAALIEGYLPQELRRIDTDLGHSWMFDGAEHVDPLKEASAQAKRLESHTTTLAVEYARQGRDWEAELQQRAKEMRRMEELGLTVAQAAPDSSSKPDSEEDEEHAQSGDEE